MIRSLLLLLILSLPTFSFAGEITDSTNEISHLNYQTDADIRNDVTVKRIGAISLITLGAFSTSFSLMMAPFIVSESLSRSETGVIVGIPLVIGAGLITGGVIKLKRANKIAQYNRTSLQIQPQYNPISHSTGITLSATF